LILFLLPTTGNFCLEWKVSVEVLVAVIVPAAGIRQSMPFYIAEVIMKKP
jgi:hypothetical protein